MWQSEQSERLSLHRRRRVTWSPRGSLLHTAVRGSLLHTPPSAAHPSTPPSAAHPSPPAVHVASPPAVHVASPPAAADSSPEHAPVDPVSARSAVHRSRGSSSLVPTRSAVLSLVVPTGKVLIYLVLSVMSMETRLSLCRGSGCWGTLWGPLTSRHAQKEASTSELSPRRVSCSSGLSCSCV